MNRPSRDPRAMLAGTFLILFGLAFTLAGGACTVAWLSTLYWAWGVDSGFTALGLIWLLVAIVCAGMGVLAIQRGVRSLGRARGGDQGEADDP